MSWDFNNPSGLGGDAATGGAFSTSGNANFDWAGASTSTPEAQGGSDSLDNLQSPCARCHSAKSATEGRAAQG